MKRFPVLRRRRAPARLAGAAMLAVLVLASPAYATAETRPAAPAGSPAAANPDEQARDLFRGGRFAEALQIYQRLRAETHHPTYLRNIGRCHQMMRQPAPAIDAFETYLREAHDLDAGERTEIDGYIAEMRRLQLSAPPPSSQTPPAAVSPASAKPPATVAATTSSSPSGGSSIVRKWWFWAGAIAVLAA